MTDTGKWDKEWFIDLPIKMKCLWFYMLDKCDLAGIWDVNFKSASFHIGQPIKEDEALKYLGSQVVKINDKYWLILDFMRFQNGWPLNDKSPVHKKIIELLNQKGIEITENNTLYHRVSNRVLDKGIVIVDVKVMNEVSIKVDGQEISELIYPFSSENFKQVWGYWKEYKLKEHKFRYKTLLSEQAALKTIGELSKQDEETAIKIIQQSIANGWQGFFEIKNNTHGNKQVIDTTGMQNILADRERRRKEAAANG